MRGVPPLPRAAARGSSSPSPVDAPDGISGSVVGAAGGAFLAVGQRRPGHEAGALGGLRADPSGVRLDRESFQVGSEQAGRLALASHRRSSVASFAIDAVDLGQPGPCRRLDAVLVRRRRPVLAEPGLRGVLGLADRPLVGGGRGDVGPGPCSS